MVESFLAKVVDKYVRGLENFAYRKGLSCTALLLRQFDVYSKEKVCYSFNGDLVKAFDRLSRKLVYDQITNPLVARIIWSWMDRSESPYFIKWREAVHTICRDKWNRGVEPGSILGPLLFIIGLNDRVLYERSLCKSLFADDGQPLYSKVSDMVLDAEKFIKYVYKNDMSLHLDGSKEASFLVCGWGSKTFKDLSIKLKLQDQLPEVGDLTIKRSYSVKQLGVYIDMSGSNAVFDLNELIKKLKHASIELRAASSWMLASECINLVSTYIVSLLRYAICVWYPVMMKYDSHEQSRRYIFVHGAARSEKWRKILENYEKIVKNRVKIVFTGRQCGSQRRPW